MSAVDTRPGYLVVYAAQGFDAEYKVLDVFGMTAAQLAQYTVAGDVRVSGGNPIPITVAADGAILVCTIPAATLADLPTLSTHRVWIQRGSQPRLAVVAGPVIRSAI